MAESRKVRESIIVAKKAAVENVVKEVELPVSKKSKKS